MNIKSKKKSLITTLIAVTIVFLLNIVVTYAYFSAQVSKSGSGSMGKVDVFWKYELAGGSETVYEGNTLLLDLATNPEIGGSVVGFKYNSTAVNSLSFYASSGSSSSYIRFWVDAYIQGDNTNYGKYFVLNCNASNYDTVLRNYNNITDYNRIYYFMGNNGDNGVFYGAGASQTYTVCSGLSISNDAPVALFNANVTISITFEAVQTANNAYLSVFGDWKGYDTNWEV